MPDDKPKGILRNKSVSEQTRVDAEHLDRQEVIRNTRLNAQLASESSNGDKIRSKIADSKAKQNHEDDGEIGDRSDHLQWDEINLYKAEQEKNSTMKIDEPKTPYEGGFNPDGEYYRDEDEEIPDFELGEGEYNYDHDKGADSLHGGEIIRDETAQEDEAEAEPSGPAETAEERHKRFEEMRKAHYHMKGNALKHGIQISDDEDDE